MFSIELLQLFLLLGSCYLIQGSQIDVQHYSVVNAVSFNGYNQTSSGIGCSQVNNGALLCKRNVSKLDDGFTGPKDSVLNDLKSFFAFSGQSGILNISFPVAISPSSYFHVVLYFYNFPKSFIGLPSISVSVGTPESNVPFTFDGNSDLTQADSTIRNVTLILDLTEPFEFLAIFFSFEDDNRINWFLISEVDIFNSSLITPELDSILFEDSSSSIMYQVPDIVYSTISVSCTVINSGSFEWVWKHEGILLSTGDRHQLWTADATRTSILEISWPDYTDSGDYQCRVGWKGSTTYYNKTIKIQILQNSSLTIISESIQDFSSTVIPSSPLQVSPSNSAPPSAAIVASVIIFVFFAVFTLSVVIIFAYSRRRNKSTYNCTTVMDGTKTEFKKNQLLRIPPHQNKKEEKEIVQTLQPHNFDYCYIDDINNLNLDPPNTSKPKLTKISKCTDFNMTDNPLYCENFERNPSYSLADISRNVEPQYLEVKDISAPADSVYSTPEFFNSNTLQVDQVNVEYENTSQISFFSSGAYYCDGPTYSYPEVAGIEMSIAEINPENLQEIKHLGDAQFGEVVLSRTIGLSLKDLGLSSSDDNKDISFNVAVKKMQLNAKGFSLLSFEREMKFMSQLRHKNVIRLLAIGKNGADPFMVMEYMANGDLNQYLQGHSLATSLPPVQGELSPQSLLSMAVQVACGMAYLASHNIIHRDVASRNCLVGDNKIIKIADFGLSRNLYESLYYQVEGKVKMPIRWMATECFYGRFSQFSDVWGYGVTVWEIYTMGREIPYSTLEDKEMVEDALKGEQRMILDRPPACPEEVYKVLCTSCWACDYRNRSTFSKLHEELSEIESQVLQ